MLAVRGRGHFTDSDVTDVAKLALAGAARARVLVEMCAQTCARTISRV